ncbi:hypothetical protein CVT24_001916 [Panaeolus cyanescens]|uniref:Uncharacterized protein n=1 Tax=Panaeolus cyanescens TaxID=181874 RepID=A0A409WSG5_9AGAR|nr:hypothetical protein CVT24_001916 [Panaeolus cyanescens]
MGVGAYYFALLWTGWGTRAGIGDASAATAAMDKANEEKQNISMPTPQPHLHQQQRPGMTMPAPQAYGAAYDANGDAAYGMTAPGSGGGYRDDAYGGGHKSQYSDDASPFRDPVMSPTSATPMHQGGGGGGEAGSPEATGTRPHGRHNSISRRRQAAAAAGGQEGEGVEMQVGVGEEKRGERRSKGGRGDGDDDEEAKKVESVLGWYGWIDVLGIWGGDERGSLGGGRSHARSESESRVSLTSWLGAGEAGLSSHERRPTSLGGDRRLSSLGDGRRLISLSGGHQRLSSSSVHRRLRSAESSDSAVVLSSCDPPVEKKALLGRSKTVRFVDPVRDDGEGGHGERTRRSLTSDGEEEENLDDAYVLA